MGEYDPEDLKLFTAFALQGWMASHPASTAREAGDMALRYAQAALDRLANTLPK